MQKRKRHFWTFKKVYIQSVLISKSCISYLKKRNLVDKWKKAKDFLLKNDFKSVDLKKRNPYKTEKYYFRLDKKYRAFCFFEEGGILKVFEINDHQ